MKELLVKIKDCRRKLHMARLLELMVLFAALGCVPGIVLEITALFVPLYRVHLWTGLVVLFFVFAGLIYGLFTGISMEKAARYMDSFGLKERILTAYECRNVQSPMAECQREDALFNYEQNKHLIKVSLLPNKRYLAALLLGVTVVIGVSCIPAPARLAAEERHKVKEQAKAEEKVVHEVMEALENIDTKTLTEEQKEQLQTLMEAMKLSREELSEAKTPAELSSAMKKINYKYEQAAMNLSKLSELLENSEEIGLTSASEIAKAAANGQGEQLASAGTPSGVSRDSTENSSTEEDGNSTENGDGNGDGNGNGNGDGNGNGNGNGDGSQGSGRGEGSGNAAHDYVSIPNAIGNDASITGEKNGDTDSDYFRQENGLAWEGEHVDYSSVIKEYSDQAYEGITTGRYPSGMEPVIRDYFESLSK